MRQVQTANIAAIGCTLSPVVAASGLTGPKHHDDSIIPYSMYLASRWKMIGLLSLLCMALFSIHILQMPRIYQGDVLILLHSPRGTNGAIATSTSYVQEKMDLLREQVESRRTLLEVIKKFDLYSTALNVPEDALVERMRKALTLKMGKGSFHLLFEHTDPQVAANVANELAKHYIEENARVRRDSLEQSLKSISTQVDQFDAEVKDMERILQQFRADNMGALPEDVPANQARLMALSSQLLQMESNLETERTRKSKSAERISGSIEYETQQRQITARKLLRVLRQFIDIDDGNHVVDKSNVTVSGTASKTDTDRAAFVEQLQTLEAGLSRMVSLSAPLGKENIDRPERTEQGSSPGNAVETPHSVESEYEAELAVLREQLRIKNIGFKEAERVKAEWETLEKKGMISAFQVQKANSTLEQARSDVQIQRSQMLRVRSRYLAELQSQEYELSAIQEFRAVWASLLSKLHALDSQRWSLNDELGDSNEGNLLRAEVATLQKSITHDFRRFLAARSELARLLQEQENTAAAVMRQEKEIQSVRLRISDLDKRLSNSTLVQVQLPELMRKYKTVTDQYEATLKQQTQAKLQMTMENQQQGESIVIWDNAVPSSSPFKPRYKLLFACASMLSVFLAAGTILLVDVTRRTFRDGTHVAQHTGIPVFAHISRARKSKSKLGATTSTAAQHCISVSDPSSQISRQFQEAAARLLAKSNDSRLIVVCSANQGDGKSFVALNLAAALSLASHERTILFDANFNLPHLPQLIDDAPSSLEQTPIANAFQVRHPGPPFPENLYFVYPSRQHHATWSLLAFKTFVEQLFSESIPSRIIVDTAAFRDCQDLNVFTDMADGIVVVVQPQKSIITDVDAALRLISKHKIAGILINSH